jgi:hypothetical protein
MFFNNMTGSIDLTGQALAIPVVNLAATHISQFGIVCIDSTNIAQSWSTTANPVTSTLPTILGAVPAALPVCTTTTVAASLAIGVATSIIAPSAMGMVIIKGFTQVLKTAANWTIGQGIGTSSTRNQAATLLAASGPAAYNYGTGMQAQVVVANSSSDPTGFIWIW